MAGPFQAASPYASLAPQPQRPTLPAIPYGNAPPSPSGAPTAAPAPQGVQTPQPAPQGAPNPAQDVLDLLNGGASAASPAPSAGAPSAVAGEPGAAQDVFNALQPKSTGTGSPGGDVVASLNGYIAKALDVAPNVAQSAVHVMANEIASLAKNGTFVDQQDMSPYIPDLASKAFAAAGIKTDGGNGLPALLGNTIGNAVLTTAVVATAAPLIAGDAVTAASPGLINAFRSAVGVLGNAAKSAPIQFGVATAGGDLGAAAAQKKAADMGLSPAWQETFGILGGLGGAFGVGGVASMLAAPAKLAAKGIGALNPFELRIQEDPGGKLFDRSPNDLTPFITGKNNGVPTNRPILTGNYGTQDVQTTVDRAVQADLTRLNRTVQDAVDSVPNSPGTTNALGIAPLSGEGFSQRLKANLDRAYGVGQNISNWYFARVPRDAPVPLTNKPGGVIDTIGQIQHDSAGNIGSIPTNFIKQLDSYAPQLGAGPIEPPTQALDLTGGGPVEGPPQGAPDYSPPNVRVLLNARSAILTAERAAYAGTGSSAPNDALGRNLGLLGDAILQDVKTALPGNKTLQNALDYYRGFADIFKRGPVADVLGTNKAGGDVKDPANAAAYLRQQYPSGSDTVKQITAFLRNPKGTGTPPGDTVQGAGAPMNVLRQQANSIESDFQNAMFAEWHDATTKMGNAPPSSEAAQAFMNSPTNAKNIAQWSDAQRTLEAATSTLVSASEERDAIIGGELSRMIDADPEHALDFVFASKNPAGAVRQIVAKIRTAPLGPGGYDTRQDALDGLEQGMLRKFFQTVGGQNVSGKIDPQAARNALDGPLGRALREVTNDEQWGRLNKTINDALTLADQGHLKFIFTGINTAATVFGAGAAKRVTRVLPGDIGTIQAAAKGAELGAASAKRWARLWDPSYLLARAVIDPKYEAILASRVPQSAEEVGRLGTITKYAIAAMSGAHTAATRIQVGGH